MNRKLQYKTCISSSLPVHTVIVWRETRSGPLITRILLTKPDKAANFRTMRIFKETINGSCLEIDSLCSDIEAYLAGDRICFSLELLNLQSCTVFQQSVLKTQHTVPYGSVTTYGRIAAEIGKPGAAQAVGNALAANPFPIVIPCHRTIQSNGSIGGFQGGYELKKALLELEGKARLSRNQKAGAIRTASRDN